MRKKMVKMKDIKIKKERGQNKRTSWLWKERWGKKEFRLKERHRIKKKKKKKRIIKKKKQKQG